MDGQVSERDRVWPFWPIVPLYPYGQRATLRREILADQVWTFEQVQGIFYVVVPIRMTVIKLTAGGLLVYAPIAPTRECITLMRELETAHGPVKYILLPTVSGLEHKVFMGPFARCFPSAQVWVAPNQWSFPLNLPLSWLGLPANRTQVLPADSSQTPFGDEFDYEILGPIHLGLGPFGEVALFHRRSRTLLLTDTIVAVGERPPAIAQLDPYPLLFHARETEADVIPDTEINRRKGWQRVVLFALYFRPSALDVLPWGAAFRAARYAPDRSCQAYFGLFPFRWRSDWERSFTALWGGGRPFVAPILQTLILNRAPQQVIAWADRVQQWQFESILPCHFEAPIKATPHQFRQAFAFLEKHPALGPESTRLPEPDLELLRSLEARLIKRGVTPPAQEKV
ncbi:DUF4336 domain-containing protein [Trichothermofontia sp.]